LGLKVRFEDSRAMGDGLHDGLLHSKEFGDLIVEWVGGKEGERE
jgi:hypothetical protein